MWKTMHYAAPLLAGSLLLWGCSSAPEATADKAVPESKPAQTTQAAPAPADTAGGGHTGTVLETMDTGGYTYVQVDTGSEQIWAAAPQFQVAVGDQVSVPAAMPMANYYSKTLDRTFDVVYFAGAISPAGASPGPATTPNSGHPGGPIATAAASVDLAGIEKATGGNTVAELLTDGQGFSGKEVHVRGKVVKFNAGIMGKNWIHIQDGTGAPGQNDLTVMTDGFAEVGDTVLVSGVAATDRDFGYGYKYPFIVEEANIAVE
jgi:hypothetical protein